MGEKTAEKRLVEFLYSCLPLSSDSANTRPGINRTARAISGKLIWPRCPTPPHDDRRREFGLRGCGGLGSSSARPALPPCFPFSAKDPSCSPTELVDRSGCWRPSAARIDQFRARNRMVGRFISALGVCHLLTICHHVPLTPPPTP